MPSARTLIAYLAAEHRRTSPDPARIADLRTQIRGALLTESVKRQLATGPISQATRNQLAELVLSGGSADGN